MTECIDRREVVEAICFNCSEINICAGVCDDIDRIINIPAAAVRPVVRGMWIDYDDDYGAYCCSVCEQNAPEDTEWPYCPHCGADMRGGDADGDEKD